jgi:hypothetical protein
LIATLIAVMVVSCGETPVPPPELSTCGDGWKVAFTIPDELSPRQVVWSDGRVYYSALSLPPLGSGIIPSDSAIRSLPIEGGAAVTLVRDWATSLWIEPDRILYTKGQQLFSAPRAGGDPSRLAGKVRTTEVGPPVSLKQTVDGTALYYDELAERAREPATLWRSDFGTTASQMLAQLTFPGNVGVGHLIPWDDDILAVGIGGAVLLVPKAGGEPRNVGADLGVFVAAGDGAILWSKSSGVDGDRRTFTMWRSGRDGGDARLFWRDKPATLEPTLATSGAGGEWLIAAYERFADGADHVAVWHLDDTGSKRIACDPSPWRPSTGHPTQLIVAPDGFYVVLGDNPDGSFSWSLVRIPR